MEFIESKEIKEHYLCLNMIVKNESRIITRLFDTVISIIDSYCICDTGSTDNTIQIIEDYFREKESLAKLSKNHLKIFVIIEILLYNHVLVYLIIYYYLMLIWYLK